jgi:protein TonB
VTRQALRDGIGALLGAVALTAVLLLAAAQLVRERPQEQDITEPVAVSLVSVPQEREETAPEPTREPEPPPEEPRLDFAPELPLPSLTAPRPAGPSVQLDPRLFGQTPTPAGPMVFEASELDRAPRPVVRTAPVYPYKARQRRIEGTVQVRFLVRADGTVGEVQVESADPPGVFEDAVRDAIARWRFEPGRLAGEAVAAWVVMPISFDLDRGP